MQAEADATIRSFRPEDAEAFRLLNEAWITAAFKLEPSDFKVLGDPMGAIIVPGGDILVAERDGKVVGTVALQLGREPGELELAKMTVHQSQRGTGLGRRLMDAAIARARQMGAKRLYLESNTGLTPAITLYYAVGFVRLPEGGTPSPYARADIRMTLELAD
jgi:GNAT superfamily N-acetyltransferase